MGVPLTTSLTDALEGSMQRAWAEHTARSLAAVQKAVENDTGAARSQFTYHVGADAMGACE